LSFHSATLGDAKLPWSGIRSIEYAGTNTSMARLTAAAGDVFTVTLAGDSLRVETGFGQNEFPLKLIGSVRVSTSSKGTADGAATAQLTIELRDGSHVVGKGLDDSLSFHSPAMGDLKLAWAGIRSLDYAGTNTGLARLTAANGDVYEVQFDAPALRVETSFGKTELPVKQIRGVKVTMSASSKRLPSELSQGLISLWSGEGDARDSVGTNNGKLDGQIGFTTGQVGMAFNFLTAEDDVRIPASPALDVAAGGSFTVTAWIKPAEVTGSHSLLEWNTGDGVTYWGVHFCLDANAFNSGPGSLYANIVDQSGAWHQIHSPPAVVKADVFQFVALSYDKPSGLARIYCNGFAVAQQVLGSFIPNTRYDLFLGRRPLTRGETSSYVGALDEVAIFNRALSAAEIQALCIEQNNGEPMPAPATTLNSTGIPIEHTAYDGLLPLRLDK
jgi:hypothetical protein